MQIVDNAKRRNGPNVSKKLEEVKEENKEEKKLKDPSLLKLLSFNKKEWYLILIGCLASIISGAVQPAFAIVFSQVITVSFYVALFYFSNIYSIFLSYSKNVT